MANYTENYGLHQWAPEDDFLRTDFNEDLAKIDNALKEVEDSIPEKLIAVGSYTGNNGTQTINVGFTPKAVFVHNRRVDVTDGFLSAMAVTNSAASEQSNNTTLLTITTNGFKVIQGTSASLNSSYYTYNYIALG